MLNSLRKSAGSWVVKILLGLLVISFAIWGIGDIFRTRQDQSLAEVGDREISPQRFERNYRNQINLLSRRLGRQISSQEARAFGVGQSVLQNMISSTAVDIHADELGLGISDDAIISSIQNEQAFQGSDGKFDPQLLNAALRNIGMSEQGFLALQREEMIREQIAGALSRGAYVPKTLVEAIYHYRNDERVIKYFVVKPDAAGTIAEPDDAQLKTFYEENKSRYMAPEYRKAGLLNLTPDAIKDTIQLTDEEVKKRFDATKDAYVTPERRTLQQLLFKDMAAAQEAADKLAKGTDFAALGKELGMTESDMQLGTFAKNKVADKKIAEAAFALEKGAVSAPIESFAPVIVKVTEIIPGEEKTFDQVKDQVREALAKERARDEIQKLYDAIEDARAGGSNVAEAAKKLNLPYAEITFDRQGQGQDGKAVEPLSDNPAAANLTFQSDVGVENNPVTVGDGYAFLDVLEVIPERQKTLDEVREQVKTAWIGDETRKAVAKKADELVEKAKGGTAFEKVAEEANAQVATTRPLKREANPKGLPRTAVSLAFTLPENGVGAVQMDDRQAHAVIQLTETKKAAPMSEKQAEALKDELRKNLSVDFLSQYVGGLQRDYGVRLNNKAISTFIGQQ